jgi:hypothetical protein
MTMNHSFQKKNKLSLLTMIKEVFEQNNILIKMKQAKKTKKRKFSQKTFKNELKLFMKNLIIENNLLYLKERLIVLFFDRLRFRKLRKHHDSSIERYLDYKIMFHAMFNNYFWYQMKNDCRKYAINYFTCRRLKVYNIQKQKLLGFLFIS